jgi:hypothetical protein
MPARSSVKSNPVATDVFYSSGWPFEFNFFKKIKNHETIYFEYFPSGMVQKLIKHSLPSVLPEFYGICR